MSEVIQTQPVEELDPISAQLVAGKSPLQYGTLPEMLSINPRLLVEGIFYYCSTLQKLFIIKSTQDTKYNQIAQVRSGNFSWVDLTFDKENNGYILGTENLSHTKTISYPDESIFDENDLLVNLIAKFSFNSETYKNDWKSLLSGKEDIVSCLERLTAPFDPVWKQNIIESKDISWLNIILSQVSQFVFSSWLAN